MSFFKESHKLTSYPTPPDPQQTIIKKLISGSQWNSCLDIHPKGDNLIVGSFDKKFVWFDLDLESHPYKHMKYHQKAIRQVVFHKKYPLFASCADDGIPLHFVFLLAALV